MAQHQSLCVHAHFYQPPREDPFTGIIPHEPGALPFSNWNERIYETCYKPNAELGNFNKISFNLGPTLIHWLKDAHPEVLTQIVQADHENYERYGVGNAIAQGYNHTILPLAIRRDKQTQIQWGIRDFEITFNRKPQGMWLPETAVDMETLELLVDNGIEFTILAPWQADVHEVNPRKAYQVLLPNHKSIKVFFYHSGISSRISFDPCSTENADQFIREYVKGEFSTRGEDQMLLVASDGELYGHHQTYRDKFLSYLLNGSLSCQNIEFSFPALQLQKQKVIPLVKIKENTSWSCHHGVERWRGVCSCTLNSEWKKPLREALNQLSRGIDQIYFESCQEILKNPWESRDRFIEVILGEQKYSDWLMNKTHYPASAADSAKIRSMLQAQVERQRMFTSCGWFFEDFDRIEPKNNVIYAAHAIWLTRLASGVDLAPSAIPALDKARSWRTGLTASQVFNDALKRFEN
ncbi:MAG: glycosyl hydrolase family [Chloroflexi bacterium]|nr:MAG: glycosyl hydrolase family [Chloroflexota bacterium]MBA4374743.1 glycoside hydrolase [Anaerolinea sp.]